jgi:MerR family mercuric resistance operon transcriptional regulator
MTIGELARSAGVHVETVRYYERCGLVPQPARRPSGYRVYSADSVARIRFIKNAQELGFSLAEIKKLLELRIDANTNCGEVRRQAQIKLSELNDKIRALQQIQHALLQLVAACEEGGPQGECPILDALAAQEHHPTAARVTSREAR